MDRETEFKMKLQEERTRRAEKSLSAENVYQREEQYQRKPLSDGNLK